MHLAILCNLFGMVKWPPTRVSEGHFLAIDFIVTQMWLENKGQTKYFNKENKEQTN